MKKIFAFIITFILAFLTAVPVQAAEVSVLTVNKVNVGGKVSSSLYGITLDDASYAIDGGLAADLVCNGSFENTVTPEQSWVFGGCDAVLSHEDAMNNANTSYETITVNDRCTVENLGFTERYDYKTYEYDEDKEFTADMGFTEGESYEFSCFVKNVDFEGTIGVYLNSKSNSAGIVQLATNGMGNTAWTKLTATLHSKGTEDGSLVIVFDGKGTIKLDFVSLVPQSSYGYGSDEWKYISLRSDMVAALKNLSPSFIRFSGTSMSGSVTAENLYSWKGTIGSPEQREPRETEWGRSDDGSYNAAFTSNAMGYHEYFQLCEDLNANAIPVVNAAMESQAKDIWEMLNVARQKLNMTDEEWTAYLINERGFGEKDKDGMAQFTKQVDEIGIKSEAEYQKRIKSLALNPKSAEFKNYVQDILDLVEYATADSTTSYWGALRAANGHAEPFEMKYLEIGSGNYGDVYFRNFDAIYKAVHKKYPKLKLFVSAGSAAQGGAFENSWNTINSSYKKLTADEHIRMSSDWLVENVGWYDSYYRDSASVALFELSAYDEKSGEMITDSDMSTATALAAFMTGAERNGDVVKKISLSPTFAKVNANSDYNSLVWFDSQELALSTDYYAELLFANNVGTKSVDASWSGSEDVFQSVTIDKGKEIMYIKLVNTGAKEHINILTGEANAATLLTLSHKYKSASNEIGKQRVAPVEKELKIEKDGAIDLTLDANSVNVIQVAYGNNKGDNFYRLPDTLNVETKAYLPASAAVAIIVISVCLFGGMAIGYIIYAKLLSNKKKKKK